VKKTQLIAITGPDKTGRSALCLHLKGALEAIHGPKCAKIACIWDNLEYNKFLMKKEQALAFLNSLTGVSRTLFLFHCISLAVDIAAESEPAFILIDTYWYKYAVGEIAINVPEKAVLAAASGFQIPDFTYFLNPYPVIEKSDRAGASRQDNNFPAIATAEDMENPTGPVTPEQEQARLPGLWHNIASRHKSWVHLDPTSPVETLGKIVLDNISPKRSLSRLDYENMLRG
jgi:hypothetical protein